MERPHVHILIIDDEKDSNIYLTDFFKKRADITVIPTFSAYQGVTLARDVKPDVILLDLIMPHFTGEDILKELKPLLPDTKFIIMTGCVDRLMEKRIHDLGVDGYFVKPIDLQKLGLRVFELLNIKVKGWEIH